MKRVRPITNYVCDNCSHTEQDPPLAQHLTQRLDDPDNATSHTDRECSQCGALTYPQTEWVTR